MIDKDYIELVIGKKVNHSQYLQIKNTVCSNDTIIDLIRIVIVEEYNKLNGVKHDRIKHNIQ